MKHKVGDEVKLVNWKGYDWSYHPKCKGTVKEIIEVSDEYALKMYKDGYFVKVLWDNGFENTFFEPIKNLKVINRNKHFDIQLDLFEI